MVSAAVLPPDALDRPLTVDDWFELPGDERVELFEGVLLLMTPPSRRHQDATLAIAATFLRLAVAKSGYAGVAPLGVAIEPRIGFEPDVVYVTRARLHILSDRGLEGPPDIAVEVLSPSTRAFDRGTKLATYLARGVGEVWLVNLDARTVEVHRTGGQVATAAFGEPVPSLILPDAGDCGLGAL